MGKSKRLYIIGAGFAGRTLANEIKNKAIFGEVVAFLDDDPQKIGKKMLKNGKFCGKGITFSLL